MNLVPWLIDGKVTRPEAGWETTPGCKACDEERPGVKRRSKPFNHTVRLREFQAPVLVVVESLHNPGLLNLICGSSSWDLWKLVGNQHLKQSVR